MSADTDDIVERLLYEARLSEKMKLGDDYVSIMRQAAEEIERLREAGRDLDRAICQIRYRLASEDLHALPEIERGVLDLALARMSVLTQPDAKAREEKA